MHGEELANKLTRLYNLNACKDEVACIIHASNIVRIKQIIIMVSLKGSSRDNIPSYILYDVDYRHVPRKLDKEPM